jgi:hypothetical protein
MEDPEVARLSGLGLSDRTNNDLRAYVAEKLEAKERANINFIYDKLSTLVDLNSDAEETQKTCYEKRLGFRRKNGERRLP